MTPMRPTALRLASPAPRTALSALVLLGAVMAPLSAGLAGQAASGPTSAELAQAVKRGDTGAVQRLLSARVDVDAPDADGTTALHSAVHADNDELVARLIEAGADVRAVNRYGVNALSMACTNGNPVLVDRLLRAGADPNGTVADGETPLMTAARAGSVAVVERLIAAGADVNARERYRGQTALMWAAGQAHSGVVRALVTAGSDVKARSSSGYTALVFAARTGDRETVDALLDAGAPIDTAAPDGGTVLVVAIVNAHFELAVHLLDRGADPKTDRLGWTPLHTAVRVRNPDTVAMPNPIGRGTVDSLGLVKALLDRGADPNARATKAVPGIFTFLNTTGATPLLLAAQAVDVPLLRLLISRGADPLAPTASGTTPLMAAAGIGYDEGRHTWWTEPASLDAVQLLTSLGSDVNVVDQAGNTAVHGAALTGANSVVRFLVERGARLDAVNKQEMTPLTVAEGIHLGALYKVRPQTAVLLRELMGLARAAGR